MDVDAMKKAAKAAARLAGTSHQAELNRIAVERGFTHWGALAAAASAARDDLPPGSYLDQSFTPPRVFLPIVLAPRDGSRVLVVRGSTYTAAQWRDGAWHLAAGGEGEPPILGRMDHEPTHFMKTDDADAERQRIASQTPRMLRGLVERVEGLPSLELRARMMLGAQFHLHAAESFAKWDAKTGPRPDRPTRRPAGLDDAQWLRSLIERARRVDVDADALATFEALAIDPDMRAILARNAEIADNGFSPRTRIVEVGLPE